MGDLRMDDHEFSAERTFRVPPHNRVHVVVQRVASGWYTGIRDYCPTRSEFRHRPGSADRWATREGAMLHARRLWTEEASKSPPTEREGE